MIFTDRIICLIIGYVFGLFQTGYLYGRCNGIDIRNSGSGNSGTTNALRVMGKKAGAIVFAGDVLKLCLGCYISVHIFNNGFFHDGLGQLICLYTGFGVILGHNYPFYLNFKGGKGIAATAGMLVVLDWRLTLIELIVFVAVVLLSHYVSLGSIVISVLFAVLWFVFCQMGWLPLDPSYHTESCILVSLMALLALWRHRANIQRLIKGEENRLF